MDSNDELAGCLAGMGMSPDPEAPIEPASSAISDIINADKTVNIDPEGIAVAAEGGFWLVSEGSGTVGDEARPFVSGNLHMIGMHVFVDIKLVIDDFLSLTL